tara:strand:+ start:347 stop:601 length:255 start_codon:yes stop_codon:yes gene_type:complete
VSDIAWEIEVLLDAVSDLRKDMLGLFVRVVSVYDDTSHELPTLAVEEEGATISTSELATVRSRTVGVIPCEACLSARDKTLATE